MKRIKLLILILAVTLLILPTSIVMAAEQAETAALQIPSGTKTTTAEIKLNGLQSFEGELRINSLKGGECSLNSIKVSVGEDVLCLVNGKKIFMVGTGEAVETTITVELGFSKDDTYTLKLYGGRTDKEGEYEDSIVIGELTIKVGEDAVDDGTSDDDQDNEQDNDDDDEEDDDTEESESIEQSQSAEQNQASENVSQIESRQKNETDDTASESSLNDVEQETVNIQEGQDEQEPDSELQVQEVEKSGKKGKDFWLKLILIMLIAFFVMFNVIYLLLRKKEKSKAKDYSGAPMIDYDINEDDE